MRKICVVTGTRAEYGLLHWVMQGIQDAPELTLQVIATGMHLSPEFGLTYREIEKDGFHIDRKVEMLLSSDTPVGLAKSMGLEMIGFADVLQELRRTCWSCWATVLKSCPLALIHRADLVIIDERHGRRLAEYLGLNVTGTLGVLVKAKSAGLIPFFRADAEKMREQGLFFHPGLIDRLASHLGET